jgi:hypothetical protein
MRPFVKRSLFVLAVYVAGVASGATLVQQLVFSPRGEQLAARVIQVGVRWASASHPPEWTVAIEQALESPEPAPVKVAQKKGR